MNVTRSKTWSALDAGDMQGWDRFAFPHPLLGRDVEGKLFLKEPLGLTGMEVSLNKLPARTMVPFFHRHKRNEELYVFLKGRGEFQIDGEVVPVREGTVIRVAPEAARTWRNHSTEDLYYIVVQAPAGGLEAGTASDGEYLEGRPRWRKSPSPEP